MKEYDITRKMLSKIREGVNRNRKNSVEDLIVEERIEEDNFLRRAEILMEEAETPKQKKTLNEDIYKADDDDDESDCFIIKASDTQFSNLRTSQEDSIRKTLGEVELKDDALKYYPSMDDIVLNGFINGLNAKFQFRYNDPSGDGCYISCSDLQLTDANTKTIEKIRAAFQNWKASMTEDGKIMSDLEKAAKKHKD